MKQKIKYIVFMVLGAIIFTTVGVTAATVLSANQISYTNSKTTATDVQGAIDDLYSKIKEYHETLGHIGVVYYNPSEGARCTESEYNTNLQNHLNTQDRFAPSSAPNRNYPTVTGLRSGCMKWYAYKDNGDGTISMLLDHNTTAKVQYNSENKNSTQKEVAQALSEDTSSWKVEARLITAQEIKDITGNKTTGDYYFNGNSSSGQAKGSDVYSWLFDNTENCEKYGCNTQDNNKYTLYGSTTTGITNGYWTSTPNASNSYYVWGVKYYGALVDFSLGTYEYYGLRPVITISKF